MSSIEGMCSYAHHLDPIGLSGEVELAARIEQIGCDFSHIVADAGGEFEHRLKELRPEPAAVPA